MTTAIRLPLLLAAAGAAWLAPAAATACGGLFCSNTNLQPVEQNAERILFEVNGDGTVSTTVEISYSGDPSEFAWVVPISDVPVLDLVPAETLSLLDDATAPQVINVPWCGEEWGYADDMGYGSGCASPFGCADSAMRSYASSDDDDYQNEEEPPTVVVEDLPQVGPYDSQVVSADDPALLVEWLADNGFLLTEAMEPFIVQYAAQGSKFLAMKLAPGTDVADIAPLRMTYPGTTPAVPLVLTSVGAEPEMGVMVFIAGAQGWQSSNWTNLQVDPRGLRVDQWNGQNSYYPLVSYMVDQVGGRAFVTEAAGSSSAVADQVASRWANNSTDYSGEIAWIDQLSDRHSYLTRMYTRISGWEMVQDPAFAPATEALSVSNMIDMSSASCEDLEYHPCGDTYCGEGAECATTAAGTVGCVCGPGTTARLIDEPIIGNRAALRPTITCQRTDFDLLGTAIADGPSVDACSEFSCGAGGSCVVVAGFPTCDCAAGGAAVVDAGGEGITCSEATETYPAESILPGAEVSQTASAFRRSPLGERPVQAGLAVLFGMMLAPMVMRRRR